MTFYLLQTGYDLDLSAQNDTSTTRASPEYQESDMVMRGIINHFLLCCMTIANYARRVCKLRVRNIFNPIPFQTGYNADPNVETDRQPMVHLEYQGNESDLESDGDYEVDEVMK
jgi:hypothetical protein